ncbi:hypothetical protein OG946_29395 [Streptomyces sp. NBC_01808]|uniref:hypothetical protein n=1 Tax=Streptomyces sp. NBC_01808 TaxID=2975947 RepID=UPI002DD94E41|nr:hypothetical protein [Streptomyces sp. NBC_01808]WSA41133.1 hypothetical protein OG946_29395 [Streptomyces sp. NBC_01808]
MVGRARRQGTRGLLRPGSRFLPTKRIATAPDIAEAIVLAATNPNVTGTVLETDGGAHLTA